MRFKRALLFFFLTGFLLVGCSGNKPTDSAKKATISPNDEVLPIEIKANRFFSMLKPWKDGKLATIDGWGRFSEISCIKNNKMEITPLIEFPKNANR